MSDAYPPPTGRPKGGPPPGDPPWPGGWGPGAGQPDDNQPRANQPGVGGSGAGGPSGRDPEFRFYGSTDPVGAPFWSPIPQQPLQDIGGQSYDLGRQPTSVSGGPPSTSIVPTSAGGGPTYPYPTGGPTSGSAVPPYPTGVPPYPTGAPSYPTGAPTYGLVEPAQGPGGQPVVAPGTYPRFVGAPVVPSAMPDGERTYPQLLRGPRRRWWRPLLALLLAGVIAIAGQVLAVIPFLAFGLIATGGRDYAGWLQREFDKLSRLEIDAAGFFYTNLGLIALIPAAGLSIWAVHHIRPKFVSSVVGGFRWRWLLRCVLVIVPLWALYLGSNVFLEKPADSARPAEWVLLLVLVVFMTPFQAAGEEYFFRGWILQNVGSWFPRPVLSLISGTIVSAVAFSAAHGSPDPWILGSLAVFAISCCLLTWRTGGLEAAIAVHAVNNIGAFFAVITFGGWDQAFIGANTKGSPAQFGIDAAVQVIAFALLWWQAGRAKVVSTYRPAMPPGPTPPPAPALPVAG